MKRIILILSIVFILNLYAMDLDQLPADVEQTLKEHVKEMVTLVNIFQKEPNAVLGRNVFTKPWLPGYFIKNGIERIINRQTLRKIIQEHKLNKLAVADKYLHTVSDESLNESSDNSLVIAKEVIGKRGEGQNLGLEQTRQLVALALLARYYDFHTGNYITTSEGMVVIIDTDRYAMLSFEEDKMLERDWILNGTRIYGRILRGPIINDPSTKIELALYSSEKNYDEKAQIFLNDWIKKREDYRLQLQQAHYPDLKMISYGGKDSCLIS